MTGIKRKPRKIVKKRKVQKGGSVSNDIKSQLLAGGISLIAQKLIDEKNKPSVSLGDNLKKQWGMGRMRGYGVLEMLANPNNSLTAVKSALTVADRMSNMKDVYGQPLFKSPFSR